MNALQSAPPWMLLTVLREALLVRIEYDVHLDPSQVGEAAARAEAEAAAAAAAATAGGGQKVMVSALQHRSRILHLPDFYYMSELLTQLGAVSKNTHPSPPPSPSTPTPAAQPDLDKLAFAAPGSTAGSTSGSLDLDNECIICMDAAVEVVLPCTHAFCNNCLSEVLKGAELSGAKAECPYCMRDVAAGDGEAWMLQEWDADEDGSALALDFENELTSFLERRPAPSVGRSSDGKQQLARLEVAYFEVNKDARHEWQRRRVGESAVSESAAVMGGDGGARKDAAAAPEGGPS